MKCLGDESMSQSTALNFCVAVHPKQRSKNNSFASASQMSIYVVFLVLLVLYDVNQIQFLTAG